MSGNNPSDNQPGQPNQGQPTPPGPQYGGPTYGGQPHSGQQYGHPGGQSTPSGPYPPQHGPGPQYGPGPEYGPGPQYTPGPQYGGGGPQQPYGMHPSGQPQPPRKSNKLPLLIGAGVLALVLIASIIGVAIVRGGEDPVAGGSAASSASQAPVESALPSDAVRGYLEALAAGNAPAALAFGSSQPADTTFLTNEVLAASHSLAPITDIVVPEVSDEYAYQVGASYKLGDQAVNADYSVIKDGDAWKLREVAYDLRLSSLQHKTLPLQINGVQADSEQVSVFPGTYTFTTGLKTIDYGKSNTLVVQSLSDYPEGIADIKPTITKTGEEEFTDAVRDSLEKCMKSKKIKNSNCPNTFDRVTGAQPDDGTLEWSYDKDGLDNLKIRLDYANPAIAESIVTLRLEATAECDGSPCRLTGFSHPQPSANLTKSPIKVTWD